MSKPFAKDGGYIEINLYNYDEYDVSQLNEWGIWAVSELERLKAINAELLAACEQALEDYHGQEPPTHLIEAIANAQPQGE